ERVADPPEIFVHKYFAIDPSLSVPFPEKVMVFSGRTIFLSLPAIAIGAALDLTVNATSSVPTAPLLSLTVSRKTYVPATVPLTESVAVFAFEREAVPPETFCQE